MKKSVTNQSWGFRYNFIKNIDIFGMIFFIALFAVLFYSISPRFLRVSNLINILMQNAALIVVVTPMTFIIVSGSFDLSPGSVMVLCGCLMGMVFEASGSIWLGVLAALAVAFGIGVLNATLIAYLNINPVITTLSCMIWARGLALGVTGGDSISVKSTLMQALYDKFLFGSINAILIIAILVFVIGWLILKRTRLGRYAYAIGENEPAAAEAGIDTRRIKWVIFVLGAMIYGLAGVLECARMGNAVPTIATSTQLDAIVAVVLGGVSMSGGSGGFGNTLVGLLFMSIIICGLSTTGLSAAIIYIVKGGIILVTLTAQVSLMRYKKKYMKALNSY